MKYITIAPENIIFSFIKINEKIQSLTKYITGVTISNNIVPYEIFTCLLFTLFYLTG